MRQVTAKIGTMRKAQTFTVSPTDDSRIMVQSHAAIGIFDYRTGVGVLNQKGSYFHHLSPTFGAIRYTFPAEFVRDCLEACPALDSTTVLGGGAVVMHNTVKVIGGGK